MRLRDEIPPIAEVTRGGPAELRLSEVQLRALATDAAALSLAALRLSRRTAELTILPTPRRKPRRTA